MDNLNIKLFFILIVLNINYIFSQDNKGVNFILLIDDELITNLGMDFNNNGNSFNYSYSIGKPLILPENFFKDPSVTLTFEYYKVLKDGYVKKYNYNIDFSEGWMYNSTFLIMKIYNLDNEKYYKAFCIKDKKYVIEIQNSVYYMQVPRCSKPIDD
ncbi:hypothetical protein [Aureivirga sp. CE67]|uniref:hypothetical protein n=1 Tax=Aureivirga sp. CE67 TaxID=1788983 RepID=UPI0018CAEFA9|nr:hypothetical protein [Aureivirga sp. CE67]